MINILRLNKRRGYSFVLQRYCLCLEHFFHRIYIYTTAQKVFTTRQSFRQFVVPLQEDSRFFICSRGVIVNLEHACDFEERFFIMDEGSKVLVNRDLAKEAHQTLMIYLLHQRRR